MGGRSHVVRELSIAAKSALPSCHRIDSPGRDYRRNFPAEEQRVTGCVGWLWTVVTPSARARTTSAQRLAPRPKSGSVPSERLLGANDLQARWWVARNLNPTRREPRQAPAHCANRPAAHCRRKPTRAYCGGDDGLAAPRASPTGGRS